jgi:hypothetical protein
MLKALYVLFALAVIGGYAYASYRGVELSRTEKGVAPAGARGTHIGSHAYWYGGYRGGK